MKQVDTTGEQAAATTNGSAQVSAHQPVVRDVKNGNAQPDKPPLVDTPKRLRLLFAGSNKWNLNGRKTISKLVAQRGGTDAGEEYHAPVRLLFENSPDHYTSVHTGPLAAHVVLISDGVAYAMGRNDNAQLALGDLRARWHPVRLYPPVKHGERIVRAACGRSHTLLVSDQGRCFGVGLNTSGQLGNGSKTEKGDETEWQVVKIPAKECVVEAAAGADFSVFRCESGCAFSAGSGQYGQLGNGRTGESIQARNRVGYDTITVPARIQFPATVNIVQIAAGSNHVLALDENGKVWSWGWGGYGQLGHTKPGDELRPRLIDTFGGQHYKLDLVACGGTASYAVQRSRKSMYYWGLTKKSGESNMYPKPVFDVQGWVFRAVACGATSTVTAAETSVISWGCSPTYGELGYGKEAKSSSKPKVVKALEGLTVQQVGVGVGFTVMLVEDEEEGEAKEVIEALEEVRIEGEVGEKRKAVEEVKVKKGRKKRR